MIISDQFNITSFWKKSSFPVIFRLRQILVARCFNFKSVERTSVTTELMYCKIVICVRLDKIGHQCLIRKH